MSREIPSELILESGTIRTMEPGLGCVEAIGIAGGRIRAAGTREAVRAAMGPRVVVVELGGTTVLPGLIDTHPHLLHFSLMEEPLVNIRDATSHAEIVERIAARARITAPGEWIMATPVGEPHFFVSRSWRDLAEGRLPDRRVLDRASRHHPVMIQAWAPVTPNALAFNSLALSRLGLDERTPDRIGDVWIEKDSRGAPTGILTGSVTNYFSSDSFNHSLWRQIPFVQLDKAFTAVERGMRMYNAQGVTTIYENHGMEAEHIECYRALRQAGALTLRVAVAQEAESYLPWPTPKTTEEFTRDCEQVAERIELHDDVLRVLGMSFMRDGACWPGTLRMREPYLGPYGQLTEGADYISPERAALTMQICGARGMRLNTIVMGTRAHDDNLAQLEAAAGVFDVRGLHWLLVHAWFLDPEQTRRYARLGMDVTTSMAFTWGKGKLFRARMNPRVLADLVPLRRILDSGLVVAGGSDWGPKCAFKQIELALTHELAGSHEPNLGPAQRVTRDEALAMWTRYGAHVLGWNDIGTLAPGKHADLIVVDRDPLTCPVECIGEMTVQATLLGGRLVHGALPS